jgi:hypothetical protein
MPFRVREGMDVGVRSSNDMYDPIGRWVGNTGCPAKSSTKGGHPTYGKCVSLKTDEKGKDVKLKKWKDERKWK